MEIMKTEELIPYENNAKKHPDQQIRKIMNSIEKYGFNQPIVVDKNNVIIVGHGRFLAANRLGFEEIPVIRKENLTPDEVKAYRIMDNKSNESDWDMDLLKGDLKDLQFNDFDMNLTGFDISEVEEHLRITDPLNDLEEGEIDEPNKITTDIKAGDIFKLGNHRLMCGDSTNKEDVDRLIKGENFRLGLTDPPYNLGYEYNSYKDNKTYDEYKDWCDKWFKIIKSNSEIQAITIGNQNLKLWFEIEPPKWVMCWNKPNGQSGCKLRGLNRWEPIMIYFEDKIDRIIPEDTYIIQTGYLSDKNDGMNELHSCPKPIKLFSSIITDYTYEKDLILDLFGGLGTTLIAAEQLNRICYMMELDPIYCQVIVNRWEKLTGNKAEKI